MAFTAREVIMTFRGQNYLSGAIRRIGYDVGALSQKAQLANQRAQLQIVGSRLAQSRRVAQAELTNVTTGQRSLAVQRARQQLSVTESRNVGKMTQLRGRYLGVQRQIMLNDERIIELQRLQAQGIKYMGMAPGVTGLKPASARKLEQDATKTLADLTAADIATRKVKGQLVPAVPGILRPRQEVSTALKAAQTEQERLIQVGNELRRSTEAQVMVMGTQSTAAQQVAAREAAQIEREAQLKDIIQTRTRAIEQNTIAQIQNNYMASKIEPVQAWEKRAATIEHTGRALSMFGLIATASVGYAAQAAAKFQEQFTLAATQARPPGAPATVTAQIGEQVSKRVLSMMREFPASAADMSQSFYEIFSGTNIQQVDKASEAVKVFNQMAVAGGADLKTMTDAGISMYNNFGGLHGEFKTMKQAADAFFATVRYGRMNAEQWAQAMPMVVGIAKEAGLTYQDVSGAMAQLTRQTGARYTSRDAMGLARLIQLLARSDVQAGLAAKGIQVWNRETHKMNPLVQILGQIQDKLHLNNKEALNFFKTISASGSGKSGTQGTIQAIRAFAFLTGNMEAYREQSRNVIHDTNEMQKSFEAMGKTRGVRWGVFVNELRVLIYEIGTQAIPAFLEMGKPIVAVVHWFNSLSDSTKHIIADFLAFGSVTLLVGGFFAAITGGLVRLIAQMIVLRRMKALSEYVTQLRAATVTQEAFNEQAALSSIGIVNPRGGTFAPVTAEAKAATAANAGLIASQRGSIMTMRGMAISAAVLGAGLIMYHKQVGEAMSATGGWQQALIALSGVTIAFLPRLLALARASTLLNRVMMFGGLTVLIAIFISTAAGADKMRVALDKLFSGWGGWIAGIVLMTAAVIKLRNAWIELQVASKLSALWTGVTAAGSAAITTIKGLTASITAYAAAKAIAMRGGTITDVAAFGGGSMIRGAGGRFIGRAAPSVAAAAGGAAVAEGTAAAAGGLGALGAAVGAFLPALAVGGALLGGLYLWKRHLDSVHDAQERVQRTQEYIDNYLTGGKSLTAVRSYARYLEAQTQAQINYNAALRAYKQDLAEGVKGDQLRQDQLRLADTSRELDNATSKAGKGLSLWKQQLGKEDDLNRFVQRYQTGVNRIKRMIVLLEAQPRDMASTKYDLQSMHNPFVDWMMKVYGITSLNDAKGTLNRWYGFLDQAQKDLTTHNRQFMFAQENMIKELARWRMVPQVTGKPLEQAAQYMMQTRRPMNIPQIKLLVKAAIALDPSVPRDIPRQYRRELNRIWRMLYTTHTPLTEKQINFLLRVVLKVDPKSKVGEQYKALLKALGVQMQQGVPVTANLPFVAPPIPGVVPAPGFAPPPKPPKQVIAPHVTEQQQEANRRRVQVNLETQMWDRIKKIVALHQKAMTTNAMKDWLAYYAALDAAQKKWTGSSAEAFQAMLDQYESSLNDSAAKISYTFKGMLDAATGSGIIATKRYMELYKQLIKAQQAYAKHPGFGTQSAVIAAQNALDKYVSSVQSANQKVETSFKDTLSNVKQMYDSFLSQEQQNFGQLFSGPWMTSPMYQTMTQWGHTPTSGDISKDMKQQISQYKNFNRMLNQLQRRGAPAELINQLRQLGPAASKQVQAMLQMTGPQLRAYFKMFRTAQQLIHKQAMADLRAQLKEYRRYGRGIALAIVNGLRDENQALQKELTRLIKSILGGQGGGHRNRRDRHPGRAVGGRVQRHLAYTVGEIGRETFVPDMNGRILTNVQTRDLDTRPMLNQHSERTNHYNYSPTIQIQPQDDVSATTQARHAEFALRQKWNDFRRHD